MEKFSFADLHNAVYANLTIIMAIIGATKENRTPFSLGNQQLKRQPTRLNQLQSTNVNDKTNSYCQHTP